MHAKRRHTATSTDPLSMMVATAHALRRSDGTPTHIARLSGLSRQRVYDALRFMQHYGFASNDNDGRWSLTPAASEAA
jgi:DNA-binding IclR family transcriptional regulator